MTSADANVMKTLVWISGPASNLCVSASHQPLTATPYRAGSLMVEGPQVPMTRNSVTLAPSQVLICVPPSPPTHYSSRPRPSVGMCSRPPAPQGQGGQALSLRRTGPSRPPAQPSPLRPGSSSLASWFRFCRPNKPCSLHNANSFSSFINQTHESQLKRNTQHDPPSLGREGGGEDTCHRHRLPGVPQIGLQDARGLTGRLPSWLSTACSCLCPSHSGGRGRHTCC